MPCTTVGCENLIYNLTGVFRDICKAYNATYACVVFIICGDVNYHNVHFTDTMGCEQLLWYHLYTVYICFRHSLWRTQCTILCLQRKQVIIVISFMHMVRLSFKTINKNRNQILIVCYFCRCLLIIIILNKHKAWTLRNYYIL